MSSSSRGRGNSGYRSPYPPLPQTRGSSATNSISAIATQEIPTSPAHSSSPAAQSSEYQDDEESTQKLLLIEALNEHRLNTIGELRRVERIFAQLGSSDLTQPMTAAWMYYVNSNSLLSELRSLTPNYPFSSDCLDEAKRQVHLDPASNRSWNYCWLVLAKVHTDRLIPTFARILAMQPEMWAGHTPSAESVERLVEAFVQEWGTALVQMLRYWESPPIIQ